MWRWDQGHLAYFQYDRLRQIAAFVVNQDFRTATRDQLLDQTGLDFAGPKTHDPWRQYARVLMICLLVTPENEQAIATPVAKLLAQPGLITCDEYMHFLARAFTDPSPAFQGWSPNVRVRYPLLFALKYVLAKQALDAGPATHIDEILGAYESTDFSGEESDFEFISLLDKAESYPSALITLNDNAYRQARESLLVLSQISYLHVKQSTMSVALDSQDARDIFIELTPIIGRHADDRASELYRLAVLFKDGATESFYDYPHTIVADVVQAGFREGTKVKKTHLTIERNQELKRAFFEARPITVCDVCSLNTFKTYPWTSRILDLHHLLPLSSGTRADKQGTTFDDIVPVCPTCHRAVHRYYDLWLDSEGLADFKTEQQARKVYGLVKSDFGGALYA